MPGHTEYTWNAKDYANHSSAQSKWADELIEKLDLQGNESLLDIGCGDGKITAQLAGMIPNGAVQGIDSSLEMISMAQKAFPCDRQPNLSFSHIDARNIPFKNQFDIVFSNAALHWVIDHQPVLAGISRCLNPGGKVLLQMGGKGNARDIISVVENLITAAPWKPYFTEFLFPYGFYAPEHYIPWLETVGLTPVKVDLIPKIMAYETKEKLAGWFRTTWLPYTQRLPENLRENFITTVVNDYLKAFPRSENEMIQVRMVRLEVMAEKTG